MIAMEQRERPVTRATERFYLAIQGLCHGNRPIQARLGEAKFALNPLHKDEIPEDMREEYGQLMRDIDTPYGATPTVSDERAQELADKILSMFTRLMGGL